MKKTLMTTAATALCASAAFAGGHGEIKLGIILGLTLNGMLHGLPGLWASLAGALLLGLAARSSAMSPAC